ncbi:MAG: 4Fe-4S dicluster domain-containing protein [Candidatus Limnocylindrales bacterium]
MNVLSEVREMVVAPPPAPAAETAPFSPFSPLAIAGDRCKGCELCIAACPHAALALDEALVNELGYHPVRLVAAEKCTSCAFCARVCPDNVFTVYAAPKGARP